MPNISSALAYANTDHLLRKPSSLFRVIQESTPTLYFTCSHMFAWGGSPLLLPLER